MIYTQTSRSAKQVGIFFTPILTEPGKPFTIFCVETTDFSYRNGKRRLPVIPPERNGGLYTALAGNLLAGGDTYDTL